MDKPFNPNEAIGEIVTKLTESVAIKAWTEGKTAIKSVYLDAKVLTTSHQKYVRRVSNDYYYSKSFLISETKTPLYNFYVPVGLSRGETTYDEANITNLTAVERFNVITGTGGSGKTMMMRHLFLDTLKSLDKVPVLVELRDLNASEKSLIDLISETLYQNDFTPDSIFFERALKAGHFSIFLDGFDEVNDRIKVGKEILKLAKDYSKNIITVSSRPDDTLSGWNLFNVWKMLPLSLEKATELVEMVPDHIFDGKIKAKFVNELQENLFQSHQSFLSNPLLLSIMVLTYRDSADIPKKLSVFYDQAYSVLFHRHDAAKGGFTRRRKCPNLDVQDFARIFSAFSILTFEKRQTSFTSGEALDFLEKAKRFVDVSFVPTDFLEDAIQAVSLLVRDGLTISFTHRSFQEYFSALFIKTLPPDQQGSLMNKYSYGADRIVPLLLDISPESVEQNYLLPQISKLGELLDWSTSIGINAYAKFLRETLYEFGEHFVEASAIRKEASEDELQLVYVPIFTFEGRRIIGLFSIIKEGYMAGDGTGLFSIFDLMEMSVPITEFAVESIKEREEASAFTSEIMTGRYLPANLLVGNSKALKAFSKGGHPMGIRFLDSVREIGLLLAEKHKVRGLTIEEELLRS